MPALEYEQHERFCQEYVFDLDPGAAVIRTCCYKRREYEDGVVAREVPLQPYVKRDINYAAGIGRRLLRYPDVRERIEELLDEHKLQTKITHSQLTARLLKIADFEPDREPTHSEVLAAVEKLAKHSMYYQDADKNKMQTFAEAMKALLTDDSNSGQDDSSASTGDVQEG